MLGRVLVLAGVIAAASVGLAGIASRQVEPRAAEAEPQSAPAVVEAAKPGISWAASPGNSGGEVRLGRASDSHFYADADINGTSVRMLVDSGASVVALTRRDAEAIGVDVRRLPITGQARTAGGDVPMRALTLDSVDIDGVEVRGVQAVVVDSDMSVSLLGQSYLSRLRAVSVEGDTMTLR